MINIAIDGHVGCGKSTLAKGLAQILNFKVFDTGAVYRSLACAYKASGYTEVNEKNINTFLSNVKVEVIFKTDGQHVLINGQDYFSSIRLEEISMLAAKVSPYLSLRQKVLAVQRKFAQNNNCIMEGRDIGTEVLPNADVKFFITAREEVRAMRRYNQIKNKPNSPSYDEILIDLQKRDYADENRVVAPLKPAHDAIILDTSEMTLEQSVQKCIQLIKEKIQNLQNQQYLKN